MVHDHQTRLNDRLAAGGGAGGWNEIFPYVTHTDTPSTSHEVGFSRHVGCTGGSDAVIKIQSDPLGARKLAP